MKEIQEEHNEENKQLEQPLMGGKRNCSYKKRQQGGADLNDILNMTGGKRRSNKRKSSKKEKKLDDLMKRLDNMDKKDDTMSGGKKKLSLKSAVQLLRKYYSEKLRK